MGTRGSEVQEHRTIVLKIFYFIVSGCFIPFQTNGIFHKATYTHLPNDQIPNCRFNKSDSPLGAD